MNCNYPPRTVIGADIDNHNILSSCRHGKTLTNNYSVTLNDYIFLGNAISGVITLTLLPAVKFKDRILYCKKIDSSANAFKLVGDIEGDSYYDITRQWVSIPIYCNGDSYFVL